MGCAGLWRAGLQEKPHPSELRTPKKDKMVSKRQSIHGVVMGAGDRSYVIRDNEIDVMKNVMGGVEDTGGVRRQLHTCCAGCRRTASAAAHALQMMWGWGGGEGQGPELACKLGGAASHIASLLLCA